MRFDIPRMAPADRLDRLMVIGIAMYGGRWRSALAKRLDVDRATLFRWLTEESPLPDDIDNRLAMAVRWEAMEHAEALGALTALAPTIDGRQEWVVPPGWKNRERPW
jgi:transposase-like protein